MAQRHMDRLTSFDTSFLANERSNGHMAIGAVLVCDGEPPSHDDFVAHIRSRVHLLPRLRQRLAIPPLGLGTPFWVDDPEFDLGNHLRRERLPAPGGEAEFHELVGEVLSPPLDRSRPLWQLVLVEGLEDDRFAIVYKTHHALADGFSAVDIGKLLFDVEPNPVPSREEAPWEPQDPPSRSALARPRRQRRLGDGAAPGALAGPGGPPAGTGEQARGRRHRRPLGGGLGTCCRPAPKVPLNVEIGPARSFAWADSPLADFKTDQELVRGDRQRRDPGGDGERPAALAPRPRGRHRRHGAEGAGPGLDPHDRRAGGARQPADGDARTAAGRHRRPGRAPARGARRDGGAQVLQAATRRRGDLGAERLVPRLRAAGAAAADGDDQLLHPPLQPAGHELPGAADSLLRAGARGDRRLPGRLPRPPPRARDRDRQLQRHGRLRHPRRPRRGPRRRTPLRLPRRGRGGAPRRRPDSLRRQSDDGDELAGDTRPRFARERERLGDA